MKTSRRLAVLFLTALVGMALSEVAGAYSCAEITSGPGPCGDDYWASQDGPRTQLIGFMTGLSVALPLGLLAFVPFMRRNFVVLCLVSAPVQVAALILAAQDFPRRFDPFLPIEETGPLPMFNQACLAILFVTMVTEMLILISRR